MSVIDRHLLKLSIPQYKHRIFHAGKPAIHEMEPLIHGREPPVYGNETTNSRKETVMGYPRGEAEAG